MFRILLSVLLISISNVAYAGDWREKYKNEMGVPCCGESDCHKVPMSRVTKGICGFMVDGICIPKSHIKPSEDKDYWHCPLFKCFFVPGGLS